MLPSGLIQQPHRQQYAIKCIEVHADLMERTYKVFLYSQVGRETEVDCALAELYVRTLSTEHLVKDTAHSDIFNSIYTRMNEVSCCTAAGQPNCPPG